MCRQFIIQMENRPGELAHVARALAARGIDTRPFFYPAHTLPMYRTDATFPVAERLGASGLNLPSWPGLTEAQVDEVCSALVAGLADLG